MKFTTLTFVFSLIFIGLSYSQGATEISGYWRSSSGNIFLIEKTDNGIRYKNIFNNESWNASKERDNFYTLSPVGESWYLTITVKEDGSISVSDSRYPERTFSWIRIERNQLPSRRPMNISRNPW